MVDTRNLEVRSQKRAVGEDYIIIYGLLYGNQYIYIYIYIFIYNIYIYIYMVVNYDPLRYPL